MTRLRTSDATLVTHRLAGLAEETGIAAGDLRDLWLTETAERLESADAALVSGDLLDAVRLVHGAAGTSGLCGATALAAQLTATERLAAAGDSFEFQRSLTSARQEFARLTCELKKGADEADRRH
jgi:HPt (histidine-containing phosphotransfer) domain-containing protein